MSQFMKALALLLNDRQEFRLNAVKIKDDLVLTITPDFKGKGKVTNITVPAEDLEALDIDAKIFGELNAPSSAQPATFQATTTDAPEREEEEEEEDDDDKKNGKSETKKAAPKKAAAPQKKAAPAKKSAPVKAAPKKTEPAKPERDEQIQKVVAAVNEIEKEENKEEKDPDLTEAATTEKNEPETEIVPEKKEAPESNDQQGGASSEQNKSDKKEEEPAGPSNKELFDHFMEEGKRAFDERKYEDAQQSYMLAKDLFPDNKKAIEAYAQAAKWVKAIADLNKNKSK